MEIPQAKLIYVESSVLSVEGQEVKAGLDLAIAPNSIYMANDSKPKIQRIPALDDNQESMDSFVEGSKIDEHKTSVVKVTNISTTDGVVCHVEKASTLQSMSTVIADDNNSQETTTRSHEVSQVLDWFRSTFNQIGKHGRVTLKDMKYAAKEYEVYLKI